jgi:Ohr subfamily peroxiredoxin
MSVLYTAVARATGDGRNGHVSSEDGLLDIDLRIPKEMGGAGAAANPEILFAAGYAACFHSALKLIAGRGRVDVTGSEVTASVGIGPTDSGGYGLTVELQVHIPGLGTAEAEALTARAHEVCPYSNATRGNIPVALKVV